MPSPVFELQLFGDKELDAALARLDERVQKRAMRKAMKKVGVAIENQAVIFAPKDTWAMAKGIKTVAYSSKRKGQFGILIRLPTRKELAALYPARAQEILEGKHYYPAVVEYKLKPFLRPAFDMNENRALREIHMDLRAAVHLD